jgi:DNA invertase Pin-like site-specific DNA recombinase
MSKTIDLLVRVSKMGDRLESAESTLTIEDQVRFMEDAIRAGGHRPGITIKMLDQSGFTIHKSPAYGTLLERVRSGKSGGAAVAYADRLSRNWRAVGRFYDELEELGAEFLIAGMPGVDYRKPDGRLILGMMHVAGETVVMGAKVRSARNLEQNVRDGVLNRVPYGFRRNEWAGEGILELPGRHPKCLVEDPATAPIVRRIFKLREDGHSVNEICRALNEDGIPAPGGGAWVHSSIRQTLRNPAYIGHVVIGGRVNEKAHEPLVSLAQFKRCQSTRKVKRNGRLKAGIAGSLVVCSGCNHPMRVIGSSAKPGSGDHRGQAGRRLSYGCPGLRSGGPCKRPTYITKDVADNYVEELLAELLEQTAGVDIVASARELEAARLKLERAREERERFVELQSALEAEDFTAGYRKRKDTEAELELRYEELLSEATEADGLPTSGSAYAALDFEGRRRVARKVIDSIVVSPPLSRSRKADITERLEVRFRGTGEVVSSTG